MRLTPNLGGQLKATLGPRPAHEETAAIQRLCAQVLCKRSSKDMFGKLGVLRGIEIGLTQRNDGAARIKSFTVMSMVMRARPILLTTARSTHERETPLSIESIIFGRTNFILQIAFAFKI
jgi:hypothetical protein